MKQILLSIQNTCSHLLLLLLFILPTNAFAYNYEFDVIDNIKYYFDMEAKVALCDGFWYEDELPDTLIIPEYVTCTFGYIDPIQVTCKVVGYGYNAFGGCSNLKYISLPGSSLVSEVPNFIFSDCSNLESVVIGDGAKVIGDGMFISCSNLKNVSLPNSIIEIGSSAFSGCKSLKEIYLPNNLQIIRGNAFAYCDSLSITIPRKIQTLSSYIFYDYINTIIAHGPESFDLASISYTKINSLELGDEIKEIKSGYSSLYKINRLTLGAGLQAINRIIDTNINEIYCNAIEPPYCTEGNKTFTSSTYKNAVLIVPKESIEKYKNADGWKRFFEREGTLLYEGHKGLFSDFGNIIKGVTADGVSQLKIYPEFTDPSFKPLSYELKVFYNDRDVTNDIALTGTFIQYNKLDNGKWGFVFTAPKDYPQEIDGYKYDLSLQLTVSDENEREIVMKRTISIARCGVLLLHGLGSSSDCFKEVKNYLINCGDYASWQVYNASYKGNNTNSFYENTYKYKEVQVLLKRLYNMLEGEGYISSKYDIVGHSMGGILARKFAQEVNAEAVNSIITVNTPHSGSQGANFVLDDFVPIMEKTISYFVGKGVPLLPFILNKGLNAIRKYNTSEFGDLGAIADLKINSGAIRMLNASQNLSKAKGIPVHAICSYMTDYQTAREFRDGEWVSMPVSVVGPIDFISVFPDFDDNTTANPIYGIYNQIFDGDWNDGVVSLTSQSGGLDKQYCTTEAAEFKGYIGTESWAHHIKVTKWYDTWYNISRLLRASKSESNIFADSFHPVDLTVKSNAQRRSIYNSNFDINTPSDTTVFHLSAKIDSTTSLLNIQLEKSNDICRYTIFTYPDDDNVISSHDTTACSFRLPESYDGDLVIYSFGRTYNNAFVGDSITIHIERKSTLDYLLFENEYKTLLNVGDFIEPIVISGWSGGSEEYISPVFYTDNEELLNIDGQTITALQEGECKLYATYLEQIDSIRVIIMPVVETTNGINELKMDSDISFKYDGSKLEVCFDIPSILSPVIEIYDIYGICHISTTITKNEVNKTYIDVSSLESGIYIAIVKTDKEYKKYKFIR